MKLLLLDNMQQHQDEEDTTAGTVSAEVNDNETEAPSMSFKLLRNDALVDNHYNGVWPIDWNADAEINLDQQSIRSFASSSGEAPSEWVFGSSKQDFKKSCEEFELEDDAVYIRLTKRDSASDLCTGFAGMSINQENEKPGTYAETDLDLPTNYSLRYAEDDSDVDDLSKEEYVADTVKAYCTEGTPYETPFNFSNSTSMSDLRIEKPINYCEEGTPGCFSRISSCGSLNSAGKEGTEAVQEEEKKDVKLPSPHEATKAVTFADDYAEQTPLMFSRSSSLESLGSIEETHSIHDDRSSIISDFSRLPSGIISPSDLPDSPTQTVPQSPKHFRNNNNNFVDYASTSRNIFAESGRSSLQKNSVFEDNVTKFKEESTPLQFSTATSISDLTIDDPDEQALGNDFKESFNLQSIKESTEKLFSEDEDDECGGIQFSMYRQSKVSSKPVPVYSDNTRNYYTEDTPAVLSHAGSQSDLSVLSMKTDNKSSGDFLSDLSSDDDEESNKLLAQCIKSGMPKPKAPQKVDYRGNENSASKKVEYRSNDYSGDKKFQSTECKDEMTYFGVENSPCPYSLRSSLSDLTVDGSIVGLVRTLGDGESSPSKSGPLSPLSNDSFGSIEGEQALLEQCINSGMPKRRPEPSNVRMEPERLEMTSGRLQSIAEGHEKEDFSENEEEALLANCIRLGMQRQTKGSATKKPVDDLSHEEDDMIQKCIQMGMRKKQMMKSPMKHTKIRNNDNLLPPTTSQTKQSRHEFDDDNDFLDERTKSGMPSAKREGGLLSLENRAIELNSIEECDELDISSEYDDDLLAQCIQSGMAKAKNAQKSKNCMQPLVQDTVQTRYEEFCRGMNETDDEFDLSAEFDGTLLDECIKSGMPKPKMEVTNFLEEDEFNSSGEFDEALLAECIKSGMPKAKGNVKIHVNNDKHFDGGSVIQKLQKLSLTYEEDCIPTENRESKLIEENVLDSSGEFDEALLAECIKSGMPKSKREPKLLNNGPESSKVLEESLRTRHRMPNGNIQNTAEVEDKIVLRDDDDLDLSEEIDEALLAECIKSGMPKAKNEKTCPVSEDKNHQRNEDLHDESGEFDEALLAECIKSGMPKAKIEKAPPAAVKVEQIVLDKVAPKVDKRINTGLGKSEQITTKNKDDQKIEASKNQTSESVSNGNTSQFSLKSKLKALKSKVTHRLKHNLKISNRKG
ncbi:PREDICTED: adenomatous polyposis coli protein-like [Nicrophorus vespilloides]|uniref:Adenomatous polyposis coli protein-like n=1 Tax=Nicrophorus vespilloides TaxID=110193 RepID=A0ABM1MN14_NICVS|nr:PREDICTED: adenomatous polyposis coli protein-like [Nicrophorus vespilloides]XP_017775964.1 PREDICTED: adenomatous polyposis coli protein-like [Nicrophorus vespilloides]